MSVSSKAYYKLDKQANQSLPKINWETDRNKILPDLAIYKKVLLQKARSDRRSRVKSNILSSMLKTESYCKLSNSIVESEK